MRLLNFHLSSSTSLESNGLSWDIHNCAIFRGLSLIPQENAAVMRWRNPSASNSWGCVDNGFAGMQLYFKDLLFLNIGQRDDEMPMKEDWCVSDVLQVDPKSTNAEPYLRQVLTMTDSFRLLFLFQSARAIEIESKTAELQAIPSGSPIP